MTRPAGSRGFTLLELLVVLAVIGLAGVVTFPQIAGRPTRMQAQTAARDIVTALRAARADAIATNRTVVVDTRFPSAGATLTGIDTGGPGNRDGAVRPVTFYPDGGASGGRFRVQPGGIAVEIDWLTGAIRRIP